MQQIKVLALVIVTCASFLAIVIIYNLMNVNIGERQRVSNSKSTGIKVMKFHHIYLEKSIL